MKQIMILMILRNLHSLGAKLWKIRNSFLFKIFLECSNFKLKFKETYEEKFMNLHGYPNILLLLNEVDPDLVLVGFPYGVIQLINFHKFEVVKEFSFYPNDNTITYLAYLTEEKFACSDPEIIKIFNCSRNTNSNPISSIKLKGGVFTLCHLKKWNRNYLAAGGSGETKIINLDSDKKSFYLSSRSKGSSKIQLLNIYPYNLLLTYNSEIQLWNLDTRQLIACYSKNLEISKIVEYKNGLFLATSKFKNSCLFYDINSNNENKLVSSFHFPIPINYPCLVPDENLIVFFAEQQLHLGNISFAKKCPIEIFKSFNCSTNLTDLILIKENPNYILLGRNNSNQLVVWKKIN